MTPPFSIWARPDLTVKFGMSDWDEVEVAGVGPPLEEEESLIAIVLDVEVTVVEMRLCT